MIVKVKIFNLFLTENFAARCIEPSFKRRKNRGLYRPVSWIRFYTSPQVKEGRKQILEPMEAIEGMADLMGAEKEAVFKFIERFVRKARGRVGVEGEDVLMITREAFLRAMAAYFKMKLGFTLDE